MSYKMDRQEMKYVEEESETFVPILARVKMQAKNFPNNFLIFNSGSCECFFIYLFIFYLQKKSLFVHSFERIYADKLSM